MSNNIASNWKHPDELIKLQRLQLRKKQLAARLKQNGNVNRNISLTETDKCSLLEAKIAQKRKNPFAKEQATANTKKLRSDLQEDDSLINFINTPPTNEKAADSASFVSETPTKPIPAKLVLQPFDPNAFSKLLHQTKHSGGEEDEALDEQKFSKHLPIDWCLKTRVRFFCSTELPATTLKTSQMASGLTSFVRCNNTLDTCSGLDISPATRFNQATYYWQHPHLPWMKLFPRNSKENIGITLGDRERKALADDWDYSFRGLFQLLRARQCAYFYLCANTFTVLFRAAGTGGRVETHALMSPSTRGMRQALRQEGIEFTMPLKKNEFDLNKSEESSVSGENNTLNGGNSIEEESYTRSNDEARDDGSNIKEELPALSDEDEAEADAWLESIGVDEKEIRRIQTAHARKVKAKEMSEDFSDNSLLLIEGVECQGFFSFLLNAKSTITNVGRLAGVPPTLLAPVAFPKATMQHLSARSSKVHLDGVDYCSIEVKGIVLPTFLPYVCSLFGETKKTFSATMASANNTLAFSKATQKLLEGSKENTKQDLNEEEDETGGQVFGQENLSDCGLLPCVIESMCRTGQNAVGLLERVCFDSNCGYAWK